MSNYLINYLFKISGGLTRDGRLFAFSLSSDPVAPPCGHLQVLIPRLGRAAGPWGTLARRRRCAPFGLWTLHWPNRTAAVKCRHVLVTELLPLHVGALFWHFSLEIKVPALVGHLHVHTEQPLEVLLQLLVVHRPEEVPPRRPHLQFQGLNAPPAWELWVGCLRSWSCWWWWWRGHRYIPVREQTQSVRGRSEVEC